MRNIAISNGLWNGLANVLGIATGVLGSILIVRSLSPTDYGEFSYFIWLAGILGTLGTLSLPNAVTKITSEMRGSGHDVEARTLAAWVAIGTVILNLILAGGLVFFSISQPLPHRLYLLIISVVLIPNGLASVMRSTLWGKQNYRHVTLATILASLIQFTLIVGAYALHSSVEGYLIAVLSGIIFQTLTLIGALIFVGRFRYCDARVLLKRLKIDIWKRYAAFAVPLTIGLIFEVVVWQRSEIFFLKMLSTIEQIGYYNLAYTFFGMFLALGWALINGYYPAISHDYGANNWKQIQGRVRQGALFAVLFSLPVAFGGWATAPRLITFLYGTNMEPAVAVSQVLFLGLIPGTVAALAGLFISAVGGIWINVKIGALVALINITMDMALIPSLGALGGSIANTASQVLNTVFSIVIIWRIYKISLPWKEMGYLSAVSLGITLLLPMMIQEWLPGLGGLLGAIIVSALVYLAAIWKLGYLHLFTSRRLAGSPA
jgi:O-antigen/teichoic acid export membrane protein